MLRFWLEPVILVWRNLTVKSCFLWLYLQENQDIIGGWVQSGGSDVVKLKFASHLSHQTLWLNPSWDKLRFTLINCNWSEWKGKDEGGMDCTCANIPVNKAGFRPRIRVNPAPWCTFLTCLCSLKRNQRSRSRSGGLVCLRGLWAFCYLERTWRAAVVPAASPQSGDLQPRRLIYIEPGSGLGLTGSESWLRGCPSLPPSDLWLRGFVSSPTYLADRQPCRFPLNGFMVCGQRRCRGRGAPLCTSSHLPPPSSSFFFYTLLELYAAVPSCSEWLSTWSHLTIEM